jgi:pyruvate-ferredoxin/flavodoxin oxidoreductase
MVDGNEAVALVAHKTNEVIAIYPITPASPMGEHADAWSERAQPNLWGTVPTVIEMQSEGGAAGTVHGALQGGALTTTFTASQGLLLKIPNMYKIAGELTPAVIHVAARTLATHALSIFCDHSDVMACRATGFAILASSSVQEAHDMALVSQAATLRGRVPVLHFFDGFRTSHEVRDITPLSHDQMRAMLPRHLIDAHRARAMNPEQPVLRGSAQNPDVFFQAREACNPYYDDFANVVETCLDTFAQLTGRRYHLFEYEGAEDARDLVVVMGSGAETLLETIRTLNADGRRTGVLKIRLFRPFDVHRCLSAIPLSVERIAVLDRTKEPGAGGEPLYKDIVTALAEDQQADRPRFARMPRVHGGRFGLSSKEFTPAMVKGIFDAMDAEALPRGFTVGIHDDVTHLGLPWDPDWRSHLNARCSQAVFYGLGSDGTVSANKNTIKIIGEHTDRHVQGYFVYDSKKSGAVTISHLRVSDTAFEAPWLIARDDADFVACHQPVFLDRYPMLDQARQGAIFLINSATPADQLWGTLPRALQQAIIDKNIKTWVVDAYAIAAEVGLRRRINTIMQTCFFKLSGIMDNEAAIDAIKAAIANTYGRKSRQFLKMNIDAVDRAIAGLKPVTPAVVSGADMHIGHRLPAGVPDFVRQVTEPLMQGKGDDIPVSLLPEDGTFMTDTARYEKRNIALEIPVWEPDLCTHCGKCVFVCPHSAIRSKAFDISLMDQAPDQFKHVKVKGKDFPDNIHLSYQVAPEDCTGCTLCVDICPIRDKSNTARKAINMAPNHDVLHRQEIDNWAFFDALPVFDRTGIKATTMKGAMLMDPYFEFSGACSGCGETPYVRLASQLFGDRMLVANATGCSSIYGGNLPTTPWSTDADGRGPAWNNSLFEDNAEFGLGIRAALDTHEAQARHLLDKLSDQLDPELVSALKSADQQTEAGLHEQRTRVEVLKASLDGRDDADSQHLLGMADHLTRKSVWIIGGDGWAYDIGFGGLDHVLTSGRNLNILVLDTEVYSNTGGQTSKATPKGAIAKFSAGGKTSLKKDLAQIAMSYGNVYVAQVAYGAKGKDVHTLRAFLEAEAWPGVSLIIAYAPCIAHGYDMAFNHRQQNMAVEAGHWPLFRFNPARAEKGDNPLQLDSKAPSLPFGEFARHETRFSMLNLTHPESAGQVFAEAEAHAKSRFHHYEQLASLSYKDEEK